LVDYLHGRGLDDERIASAPLGVLITYGMRWITIPHIHGGKVKGVKLRHDPFEPHEKGKRYLSVPGSQLRSHLWNYDVAVAGWFPVVVTVCTDEDDLVELLDGIDFDKGTDRVKRVYLCDSELDALAIWSLLNNPCVVAVPDGGFKEHHARALLSVDELVFVTDNDGNGTGERATADAIALCGRGEMVLPPFEKDTGDWFVAGRRNIEWLL
jgi:hypothetical protein